MNKNLQVKILNNGMYEYPLRYATEGSAGLDLRACIDSPFKLFPGQRKLIKTGVAVHINDPGIVGFITSRSGLNLKHGVRVSQGVGTIDSDYQDELGVILYNDGQEIYTIEPYDRIAQIVFIPVYQMQIDLVEEFDSDKNRGGGFGSTGKA
jgi:dUTP pyrophosphatase